MTTLISFLGKSNLNTKEPGYRTANYVFPDGMKICDEKYIGLALLKKLSPKRLILLGTTGSMWDIFFEQQAIGNDEQQLDIIEALEQGNLNQDKLAPFSHYLTQKLGCQVECVLIPLARNEQEQVELLSHLANRLSRQEIVALDVTHGFRHLPMLALVAARFLEKVNAIRVEQIYYGALDMTEGGLSQVLELNSLLNLLDWIDALSVYDKDGDYSGFANLLEKEGLPKNMANQLRQAAYFERITNATDAAQRLNTANKSIEDLNTPLFSLFKEQLQKRFSWAKSSNRGLREQRLAEIYLARRDYLRAVIFALEGMISAKVIQHHGDTNSFEDRDYEKQQLIYGSDSFRKLNSMRNNLAHGNEPDRTKADNRFALQDEDNLQKSLRDRLKHLFN